MSVQSRKHDLFVSDVITNEVGYDLNSRSKAEVKCCWSSCHVSGNNNWRQKKTKKRRDNAMKNVEELWITPQEYTSKLSFLLTFLDLASMITTVHHIFVCILHFLLMPLSAIIPVPGSVDRIIYIIKCYHSLYITQLHTFSV